MRDVTIRRCPTCSGIVTHTDQLADELRKDPNTRVNVVDGSKGEFSVEVDGGKINSMKGESLRETSDLANEIRGRQPTGAM